MVDVVDKVARGWMMSRVKSKDTTPEFVVRRLVYRAGYRYRLHYNKLPGRPDLVFIGLRKVIFVHGCFWHQHVGCKRGKAPQSNLEFWGPKLAANCMRDAKNLESLTREGWGVLVVWECKLKDLPTASEKIFRFLSTAH